MGQVPCTQYEIPHFESTWAIEHNKFTMIKEVYISLRGVGFNSAGEVFECKEARTNTPGTTNIIQTTIFVDEATLLHLKFFLFKKKRFEARVKGTKEVLDTFFKSQSIQQQQQPSKKVETWIPTESDKMNN